MTVITDFESGPGIWLVVAGTFATIAQIPEQNRELAQTKEYLKRANLHGAPPVSGLSSACRSTACYLSMHLHRSRGSYSQAIALGFGLERHSVPGMLHYQGVVIEEEEITDNVQHLERLVGMVQDASNDMIFVIDSYWMWRLLMKKRDPAPGTLWRTNHLASTGRTFERVDTTPVSTAS